MLRLSQEAIAKKIDSLKCVSDPGRSQPLVEPVSAIGWKGNIAVHMRDRPNDVAGARMLAVTTLNRLDSSLYPLCCGDRLHLSRGRKSSINLSSTRAPASASASSTCSSG